MERLTSKMEYYQKRYSLKRVEVRIPCLGVVPGKKPRVSNNKVPNFSCDKLSRLFWKDNSIAPSESTVKEEHLNLPESCTTTDERSSSTSTPISWTGEPNEMNNNLEKIHDNCYEENCRILNDLMSASVRLPHVRTEELEEGVPVVRVGREVVRVNQETKEQIEKGFETFETYHILSIDETKPKICLGKECNSISTFIEEEENWIDRTYFHVLSTEMFAENEICLNGVFVGDF